MNLKAALTAMYKKYPRYADMDPEGIKNHIHDPEIEGFTELLDIIIEAEKKGETDDFDYERMAISFLQKNHPKLITPDQYEEITGFSWPHNAKVHYRHYHQLIDYPSYWDGWMTVPYHVFMAMWCYPCYPNKNVIIRNNTIQIVCATESGPPPDGWQPEELKT
jgi:hypothetical protein